MADVITTPPTPIPAAHMAATPSSMLREYADPGSRGPPRPAAEGPKTEGTTVTALKGLASGSSAGARSSGARWGLPVL